MEHQSGGLGVPSSNLGAPTKYPKKIKDFQGEVFAPFGIAAIFRAA